jgi:hypothetical protein
LLVLSRTGRLEPALAHEILDDLVLDRDGQRAEIVVDGRREVDDLRLRLVLDVAHDRVPVVGGDRHEAAKVAVDDLVRRLHRLAAVDAHARLDLALPQGHCQLQLGLGDLDGGDERQSLAGHGHSHDGDRLAAAECQGRELPRARTSGPVFEPERVALPEELIEELHRRFILHPQTRSTRLLYKNVTGD